MIILTSGEYVDHRIEQVARVLRACEVEEWRSFYDDVKIERKPDEIIADLVERGFIQLLPEGEVTEISVGEYDRQLVEFREIGEPT